MVDVKLYVEGGGETSFLKTACRKGFSEFLKKAGLEGKLPRIVASGSRMNAYNGFCNALKTGQSAMLLVDSESAVIAQHQLGNSDTWLPWQHLAQRQGDDWARPNGAEEMCCHLMVECMENWFLSDRDTLKKFFGQGFKENKLPSATKPIESVSKVEALKALKEASRQCATKSEYGKGEHSFEILALVDSTIIQKASPWALRFVTELKKQMGA